MGKPSGGGGGGGISPELNRMLEENLGLSTDIARQTFEQASPLRQNLINRSAQFLGMSPQSFQPLPTSGGGGVGGAGLSDEFFVSDFGNVYPQPILRSVINEVKDSGQIRSEQPVPEGGNKPGPEAAPGATPTGGGKPGAPQQGALDVTASPLFAPVKQAAENQFQLANEQVLANLPAGGLLQEQLAENARSRGQTLTGAAGNIAQGELDRAFSLATGQPLQAQQGLGSTVNALTSLAGQQAQASASSSAGKNQMLGNVGSSAASLAFK